MTTFYDAVGGALDTMNAAYEKFATIIDTYIKKYASAKC